MLRFEPMDYIIHYVSNKLMSGRKESTGPTQQSDVVQWSVTILPTSDKAAMIASEVAVAEGRFDKPKRGPGEAETERMAKLQKAEGVDGEIRIPTRAETRRTLRGKAIGSLTTIFGAGEVGKALAKSKRP